MDRTEDGAVDVDLSDFELSRVEVGDTRPGEIPAAVEVVARALSANPMARVVIGPDAEARHRHTARFFRRLYKVAHHQRPLVARLDGRVVASTNDLVAGACRFGAREGLRILPDLMLTPPAITARSLRWLAAWERRDPERPHAHFGPFGVLPELQGRGIGSLVLSEYTRRLDAAGEHSYLEADKPENVALYGRFGFQVIEEAEVLGVHNWFMWREAGADAPATRGR
jgi:ribosomal protein S18 acetylase RimI-like enzyme